VYFDFESCIESRTKAENKTKVSVLLVSGLSKISEMSDPIFPLLFGTTRHVHPQHPERHSVLAGTYVLHLFLAGTYVLHLFLTDMHMLLALAGMHTFMYVSLAHTGRYLLFEICQTISAA
jgi:hypothetical protein